ncbi:MAG: DUF4097 family beta strand repeat-containing protein [Gemmatimonadales bacterium]
MEARAPDGSPLLRFWRGWRREILRGAVLFALIVAGGLAAVHVFRSFAAGWSDLAMGGDWAAGGDRRWQEAFLWSDRLKPGDKVWIRNRSGAVTVAAAPGESLLVVAEKSWHRSSPELVNIVAVPHEGGVTICALWEADKAVCAPRGDYKIQNPRRGDVAVRFTIHVPRGVALDASTINGLVAVAGVDAPVTASTVNGKVQAEIMRAPFEARTVNGQIDVAIALRRGGPAGAIDLGTVNGSIHAALAPGLDAELEASTVNGRIDSEIPVAVTGRLTSRKLAGRLGSGGAALRLHTVNGSIHLVERGPEGAHVEHEKPHVPPAPSAPPPPAGTKVRVRVN